MFPVIMILYAALGIILFFDLVVLKNNPSKGELWTLYTWIGLITVLAKISETWL